MSNPIILDMDPGIDDVLALVFAIASPELSISAVTTTNGNVNAETGAKNVRRVYEMIGETPIPFLGIGATSIHEESFTNAHEIHGKDGMGNIAYADSPVVSVSPEATSLMWDILENSENLISLVATGPLTNVGRLLSMHPSACKKLEKLTFMGGTINEPGNICAGAEFNMYADPENALAVMRSALSKTMVGLDVTRRVMLTPDILLPDLESMKHPNAQLFAHMIRYYMSFHRRMRGVEGCYLHDPLAVAVALDDSLVQIEEMYLDIETKGEFTRGMTVESFSSHSDRKPNCRVCMNVDSERFMEMFLIRITTFLRERWNA